MSNVATHVLRIPPAVHNANASYRREDFADAAKFFARIEAMARQARLSCEAEHAASLLAASPAPVAVPPWATGATINVKEPTSA